MIVGGDVSIVATDNAEIDAQTYLKAIASANNDSGSAILNDLAGALFDSYDYTSSSGNKGVAFGEVVRVNDVNHQGDDTPAQLLQGETVNFGDQGTFQYLGADVIAGGPKDLKELFDPLSPEWEKVGGEGGRLYEYQKSIDLILRCLIRLRR